MCQPDTYCISPSWTVSVDFSTNEVSTAEHFSQSISILSQERDEDAAAEMLLINYGNMCLFSLTVVRSGCALIWVSRKLTSMKMRAVHCEDRARGTRKIGLFAVHCCLPVSQDCQHGPNVSVQTSQPSKKLSEWCCHCTSKHFITEDLLKLPCFPLHVKAEGTLLAILLTMGTFLQGEEYSTGKIYFNRMWKIVKPRHSTHIVC